jgi:hypothetical protein
MFICGDLGPHCADCADVGENLCDYPVGKGKTCDRSICETHSHEIGPNLHYCDTHYKQWLAFRDAGGVRRELENVVPFKQSKNDA